VAIIGGRFSHIVSEQARGSNDVRAELRQTRDHEIDIV